MQKYLMEYIREGNDPCRMEDINGLDNLHHRIPRFQASGNGFESYYENDVPPVHWAALGKEADVNG